MLVYSWQLAIVVILAYLPVLPLFRILQRGQLRAYDLARTRTGDMLSEVSEVVGGAAVVRAYGLEDRARRRLRDRIRGLYQAHMRAGLYFAVMFPLGDVFGSIAIAAVTVVAAFDGQRFGLNVSEVVAFLFLTNLILSPIAELSEILDQTQTAIAGWRKVIAVLDVPVDVVEPTQVGAAASRTARGARRRRRVRVPRRRPRAARHRRRAARGRERCRRRRDRVGQDDVRQVAVPAGRPDRRPRRARRCRPAFGRAGRAASTHPPRSAGRLPLRHDDPRERAPRARRRDRRRRRDGVRDARARLVAREHARRPRHRGRRAGREPLGRRAPARLARTRSSASPGCSSSTRRPARSTRRPSGRSRVRCCGRRGAARRSAWRTASRPRRPPTWCSCSTRACSSSRDSHAELLALDGVYAALYASWLGNTQARTRCRRLSGGTRSAGRHAVRWNATLRGVPNQLLIKGAGQRALSSSGRSV